MDSKYCTVQEAAQLLQISTDTVRRYIARGLIYAERVGPRLIRIQVESLEALGTPMQYLGDEAAS